MPDLFSITVVFEQLPKMDCCVSHEAYQLALNALKGNSTWSTPALARVSYEFYAHRKFKMSLTGYLIPACQPWLEGLRLAGLLASTSGWYLWMGAASLIEGKHNQTRLIIEHRI